MEASKAHVAIVCISGMGHLTPLLELGSRLVNHHNLQVTVLIVPFGSSLSQNQLLQSACAPYSNLFQDIIQLPPVDVSNLVQEDDANLTRTRVIMRQSIPALKSTLCSLTNPVAALMVDFLGSQLLGVAREIGIPKRYVFLPSNAWYLAFMISMPMLVVHDEGDSNEPVKIPGCKQVGREDLLDPIMDRSSRKFREAVMRGIEIPVADGILVNTWEHLEPVSLRALREVEHLGRAVRAPVYPVGPLRRQPREASGKELLGWLDCQPGGSVLYVSFGSWGTLSFEQMTELAWGLELSQQRFVWVVRRLPSELGGDGACISKNVEENHVSTYLPDGFLARTQNVGLVVTEWAPQVEILNHPAVGGFLSHCGWNSTLESITSGVPMIAWPLYSEQKMNAALLTEEFGVAVRPGILPSQGIHVVGREEIKTMIRGIMVDEQGMVIRERIKKLKDSAVDALSQNGFSYNALAQVAKECDISMQAAATPEEGPVCTAS